jgi:hypothetical protein
MTTSLSRLAIISGIMALREARVLMRLFINLSLNFAPHEITKGLQSFELGGQISLDQ